MRELARQHSTFFRVLCLFVSRQLAGDHALCVELRAYTDGLRQRKEKSALMSMSSSPAASSSTRHLSTTASVAYAVASSWEARTTASDGAVRAILACSLELKWCSPRLQQSMATDAREIKGAPQRRGIAMRLFGQVVRCSVEGGDVVSLSVLCLRFCACGTA